MLGAPRGGHKGAPRGCKSRIQCTLEGPRETASVGDQTTPFNIDAFREGLSIKILESNEEKVVLQLRGCDASLANAIRRILISEVPTVALETIQASYKPEILTPGVCGLNWVTNPRCSAFGYTPKQMHLFSLV